MLCGCPPPVPQGRVGEGGQQYVPQGRVGEGGHLYVPQGRVDEGDPCRCHRAGWVKVALSPGGISRSSDTCFKLGSPEAGLEEGC